MGSVLGIRAKKENILTRFESIFEEKDLWRTEHHEYIDQKNIDKAVNIGNLQKLEKSMGDSKKDALHFLEVEDKVSTNILTIIKSEFMGAHLLIKMKNAIHTKLGSTKKKLDDLVNKDMDELKKFALKRLNEILKKVYGDEATVDNTGNFAYIGKNVNKKPTLLNVTFSRFITRMELKKVMKNGTKFRKEVSNVETFIKSAIKAHKQGKIKSLATAYKNIATHIENILKEGKIELKNAADLFTRNLMALLYIIKSEKDEEAKFAKWGEEHLIPQGVKTLGEKQISEIKTLATKTLAGIRKDLFEEMGYVRAA